MTTVLTNSGPVEVADGELFDVAYARTYSRCAGCKARPVGAVVYPHGGCNAVCDDCRPLFTVHGGTYHLFNRKDPA